MFLNLGNNLFIHHKCNLNGIAALEQGSMPRFSGKNLVLYLSQVLGVCSR